MNGSVPLTTQTPLQNEGGKKSLTTDAQHNIRFRKLILGVIEKAANSLCIAPTLKSSQLVPAPMAPLCYRLVFTSLPRQPRKRENILCCPTIVALAASVRRRGGSVGMGEQRRHTEQRHMSLARIIQTPIKAFQSATRQRSGWGGAKSVWGTRLWRGERATRNKAA